MLLARYQGRMIEEGLFRYIVHHLQGETLFEVNEEKMITERERQSR